MAITSATAENLINAIQEAVNEATAGRSVHADDVDGLEDAICDVLRDNREVDADDVRNLDDAIDSRLDDRVDDAVDEKLGRVDLKDRLGDHIADEVREALADELPKAVRLELDARPPQDVKAALAETLRTPEFRAVLQQEVRLAMIAVVQGFLAGFVPVAAPVSPPQV